MGHTAGVQGLDEFKGHLVGLHALAAQEHQRDTLRHISGQQRLLDDFHLAGDSLRNHFGGTLGGYIMDAAFDFHGACLPSFRLVYTCILA